MATNTSDFFTFSKTAGTAKNLQKPTDGGDNNLWGGYINVDLDTIVGAVNATSDLIADANQNELVDFTATGSAVNHVGITNAATGNGPTIEAKGDDPNIDLNVKPKGTGAILLKDGDGNELVKTSRTASAVNEVTVANAATGNGPTLSATGDDTNIDLNVKPKGTGSINLKDGDGNELVKTTRTASAVNELTIVNAATGNPPEIQATGDDTNIHLKLTPKGTGGVSVGDILHAFLPVGMISPFGITTVPAGWLYCDGTTLGNASSGATNASDDYEALFDLIKNLWGNSGGTFSAGNTINLPDLEGAFLRGTGTNSTHQMADGSDYYAGPNVGSFDDDQMFDHRHDVKGNLGSGRAGNAASAAGSFLAGEASTTAYMFRNDTNGNFTSMITGATAGTGGHGNPNAGDETRPFNAGVKYCIKF